MHTVTYTKEDKKQYSFDEIFQKPGLYLCSHFGPNKVFFITFKGNTDSCMYISNIVNQCYPCTKEQAKYEGWGDSPYNRYEFLSEKYSLVNE